LEIIITRRTIFLIRETTWHLLPTIAKVDRAETSSSERFERKCDASDMRRRGRVPKPKHEQFIGASDSQGDYTFQAPNTTRK
jgi:hypothetical protein